MASSSFLDLSLNVDMESRPEEEEEPENCDSSKLEPDKKAYSSVSEILSAYEEKLEFKDDKEMTIQNVSTAGVAKFVPQAEADTVQKVVELVAWKTLGYDIDSEDKIPETPDVIFKSLKDLLNEETEYLNVGCPLFNQILDGGLRCGTVTEVTGPSGAGKSQVCLHLASIQAMQETNIIYLQTEASFPLTRLKQILDSRCADDEDMQECMDRIFIKKVHNYNHLESLLKKDIPLLIQEKQVKLLIIDSIAAVIRGDRDIENISERTEIIYSLGNKIQTLCSNYKICVVLTNQVSSAIDYPGHTFGRDVIPTLGPLWTNFINTRLFVTKTDFAVKKGQIEGLQSDSSLRSLEVDFSSYLPENFFNFVVLPSGILGINITE